MRNSYHDAFRAADVPLWSSSMGQHFVALLSEQLGNQGVPASVPISLLPFQIHPPLPCTHTPVPLRAPTAPWPRTPFHLLCSTINPMRSNFGQDLFFILFAQKRLQYLVSSPRRAGLTWLHCMSAFHFPFLHLLLKLLPSSLTERQRSHHIIPTRFVKVINWTGKSGCVDLSVIEGLSAYPSSDTTTSQGREAGKEISLLLLLRKLGV